MLQEGGGERKGPECETCHFRIRGKKAVDTVLSEEGEKKTVWEGHFVRKKEGYPSFGKKGRKQTQSLLSERKETRT